MANQTVDGRTPAQPGMYKIPIKINGINYLSTRAEFQPPTVSKAWVLWHFDLGAVGFSWLCFLCLPKKASTHQGKPSFHGYIAVKEAGSIGKMPSQNHLCLGTIKDPAGHSECKIMHAENAKKLLVNRKSTKYSIIQYLIYQNLLSCCELPNCTKRVIKKLHILALSAPGCLPVYPYRGPETSLGWKYMFAIHLSKAIHQFSKGLSNKLPVLPWWLFLYIHIYMFKQNHECVNKWIYIIIYMYTNTHLFQHQKV